MKKYLTAASLFLLLTVGATLAEESAVGWSFKIDGGEAFSCYQMEGKDKTCSKMEGVDMNSFEILNGAFAKDDKQVYLNATAGPYALTKAGYQDYANIDIDSFTVINYNFAKDKNYLYSVTCTSWDKCSLYVHDHEGVDAASFELLNDHYAVDANNAYYYMLMCAAHTCSQDMNIIPGVDLASFEVLKEDYGYYAMDKNNIYENGKVMGREGVQITNNNLYNSLKGRIILRVEENGEAYYVNPKKQEMFYLFRPAVAFKVMREQGIGISNDNLKKIPVAENNCPSYMSDCGDYKTFDYNFSRQHLGKIFLQVEENGEAWYVNPADAKRYFLGRPEDAFKVMRELGLGVSNVNFESLTK